MNIVYKFTSRVTGKWYIGSKTECKVVDDYILNRKGKKYFTSSYDKDLLAEFHAGNMVLEVLADNVSRENLLDVESMWQEKENAVDNKMSYNKVIANKLISSCARKKKGNTFGKGIGNSFNQTANEIANHNSLVARRDLKAQEMGFVDCGDMLQIVQYLNSVEGITAAALDRKYNQSKYFARVLREVGVLDFNIEVPTLNIRELMLEGATFIKACEIVGVSFLVARREFGSKFVNILDVEEKMAIVNGYNNRLELDKAIMRKYLEGSSISQIRNELDNISNITIQRTIERVVRERLKASDFE